MMLQKKVGIVGKVVQQMGMIRLGRTTVALLHLCLIGLRHQQTVLNLICQSLGSQLVHPVNLNLPKHPCVCMLTSLYTL